jgi:hypothetical protein
MTDIAARCHDAVQCLKDLVGFGPHWIATLVCTHCSESHTLMAEEAATRVMVWRCLGWVGLAAGEGNPRMGHGRLCRCRGGIGERPPPPSP